MAGQANLNHEQNDYFIDNVCMPYFRALQNGDIEAIIARTGGPLYKRYQVLLEQNSTYAQFLRDYFNGIQFQLAGVTTKDNYIIVEVVYLYPDGSQNTHKLLASNLADSSGQWKFIDVITP